MLTLWYRGAIVAKKNNKRIMRAANGRPWIASSQEAKAQEQIMADDFAKQATEAKWQANKDSAYMVTVKIVEPDKHRRDLDNQVTAILDALVLAEILPDDDHKHVQELHVFLMGYDKTDPHATIVVNDLKEASVK